MEQSRYMGDNLHGAIARSVSREDTMLLRWRQNAQHRSTTEESALSAS